MNASPSIFRRPASEKSNVELVNALRSNILHSKQLCAPVTSSDAPSSPTNKEDLDKIPYTEWTARKDGILFVPALDPDYSGLSEERSQYDITVKLFFLPKTSASERFGHAQEALDLVLRDLHVPYVDLLIVSFPGMSFDGDAEDDCYDPFSLEPPPKGEDLGSILETWKALEYLQNNGLTRRIGLAEFGSDRLQKFLPNIRIRPSVNQINLKDCCTVPAPLMQYAKKEKIELLTHNDCTNILPSGTVRELLGTGGKGRWPTRRA